MIPDFPIDIRIRLAELKFFFCCFLTLLIFCPVSWVSFAETSQQGRKLAKSGSIKKKFQFCQSYFYVNRKVWYHQIWIPNNLGFIVSDLIYIPGQFRWCRHYIDSIHTPASCTWFISEFFFLSSFFDSLGAYGRENIS